MLANMGTPASPEGLPHWTAKSLLAHRLRRGTQNEGRRYGAPFSRELRNVSVPEGAPKDLQSTMDHVQDRVDSISPLAFAFFDEPPHDDCDGGIMVVNLLDGMRGGTIKHEEPFGDYQPDIALYRKGAPTPHLVIEVVHTSSPSERKTGFYEAQGIVAFALHVDASYDISRIKGRTAVKVFVLSNAPCGREQREGIWALDEYIADKHKSGEHPFIGMKCHPSGSQEFIRGTYDPLQDEEWHAGEPEVFGFCPTPVRWTSPPRMRPLEERSLSKDVFLAYMVINLERLAFYWHETDSRQEKSAFRIMGNYAEDLLDAVHVPR